MTALLGKIPVEKIRSGYLIILLICLCVRNIGVYAFVTPMVDVAIFSGLAAFGFLLFFLDAIRGKIDFRATDNIFLMLFICVLIVSSVINFRYGIFQNIKECIWTIISFFVVGSYVNREDMRSTVRFAIKIQNVVIIFWFVMSFLSICTAILQIGHIMNVRDNSWIGIGVAENRLFGVFVNPNSASIVAVIAILFSIFQMTYGLQGALNIRLHIANIIIQLVYIALAESRGSIMVLLFLSFMLVFICSFEWFNISRVKKFIISLVTAAMFTVALYFLMSLITQMFSVLPSFSKDIEVLSRKYGYHARIGQRLDYVDNDDISNLRFKIWISAWEIFKNNWLFGVTPGNILNYAKSVMPSTFMAERGYRRAHSVWFGIPLYTGICGAFCMFGFFIKKAWDFIGSYKRVGFKREIPIYNLCAIVILCVWCYGLVESEILFVNSVCSFIFWFFIGISVRCINFSRKGIKAEAFWI